MPQTDALPASQLPSALWNAGVRPAGVQYDAEHIPEPYVWVRDERDLDIWHPHKRSDHAWQVLAWARAHGWHIGTFSGQDGGSIQCHQGYWDTYKEGEASWQEPTEAAECEAICRAVLRAAQGGTP